MIHIFILIRSLHTGGTECQLIELVKGIDKSRFNITVGLFYNEGELRSELVGIPNVTLLSLEKANRWDLIRFGIRLVKTLKSLKPDILYSFLPEANIVGLVTGRLAKVSRIVWGVRASNMDTRKYHWLFGVALHVGAWLSRFPDAIIVNSFSGLEHHKSIGYDNARMTVVPNGINTVKFKPDEMLGKRVRSQWGIGVNKTLIALIGRMDPLKDHSTFLHSARILLDYSKDVRFICVGDAQEPYRSKMLELSSRLGLNEHLVWNEARRDMPAVYNAIDIVTSSSRSEGFSNVIGEAMACGVPCVVTDVGDSAVIVGETGVVVPPKDPQALADGWISMMKCLNDESYSMKEMPSERIVSNYNSKVFIQRTSRIFLSLL
jgi:glycosyltransferase involved in cell wall biosynthesis